MDQIENIGQGVKARKGMFRSLLFAVICIACTGVAVGYVLWTIRARPAAGGAASTNQPGDGVAALQQQPHVVFQHIAVGDTYSTLSLVARDEPEAARASTGLVCERVYYAAERGVCVQAERGTFDTSYTALLLSPDFQVQHRVPLEGIISRARVSPDGRYGATTSFVFGHSYADADFSTQTLLIDMAAGTALADLEQFTVIRDGSPIHAADFNFWGVTFAHNSNRFYATLRTAGQTYLVEGDVQARQMRVLRENVECPSLSPDDTRIAFKKLVDRGTWQLSVLDLATLRETALAETQSVDDQAEWLDDQHVLYSKGSHVWIVPSDGNGTPRTFLSEAFSPAVVR